MRVAALQQALPQFVADRQEFGESKTHPARIVELGRPGTGMRRFRTFQDVHQ